MEQEMKVGRIGVAGETNISREKAAGTSEFRELFSDMVAEKLGKIPETIEDMTKTQKELKELRAQREFTETVKHVLPDGSIRVSEYKQGHLESCYIQKPKLHAVVDTSKPIPRAADGSLLTSQQETKLVPCRNILEE